MRSVFFHLAFAILSAAALAVSSPPARAVAPFFEMSEDVTKLQKPTVSYTLLSREANTIEVRLVDLDGQNDRLWMGDGKHRPSGPVWSPNGKRMAIVIFDRDDWTYSPYVLDLESGKATNLYHHLPKHIYYTHLDWSPDGRWLAVSGGTNTQAVIYKVNVETYRIVQLTHAPRKLNELPNWSPDGKKIAFTAYLEPIDVVSNRSIFVIDAADGRNRVELTDSTDGTNRAPIWSPDGRWIAYTSFTTGASGRSAWEEAEMFVMRPDGSNPERLTSNDVGDFPHDWSPDSKWILYHAFDRGEDGELTDSISLMHIETRETRMVKQAPPIETTWTSNYAWVMAGQSRFLSVDSAGAKKESWGSLKKKAGEGADGK